MNRNFISQNLYQNNCYGFFFISLILFASCNNSNSINVEANTNDTTPPVIVWTIKNNTQNTEKTFPAGKAVYNDANTNDELVVSAVASDNGGLTEVDDWVGISYMCGDGGAQSSASSNSPIHKTPMKIVNGKTLPSWPVSFAATTFNLPCQSGFHFISGGYAFVCEATNAAHLKTTSSLSVNGK